MIGHSITYRVAIGPRAGQKVFALRTVPAQPQEESRKDLAQYAGFSLHAGIGIEAHARSQLERLCRYVSRPAVAEERIALTAHGEVRYQLTTPYRDGTSHIVLAPLDFMAGLAALVPPPRAHLIRDHGVFAPHAALRAAITPAGRGSTQLQATAAESSAVAKHVRMSWAQRLARGSPSISSTVFAAADGSCVSPASKRPRSSNTSSRISSNRHPRRSPHLSRPHAHPRSTRSSVARRWLCDTGLQQLRDLSAARGHLPHPRWPPAPGTFLDVAERLPYLSELGISAIQLLPIQEFPTQFSLGYNGVDYFSPESDFAVPDADLAAYVVRINALLTARGLTLYSLEQLRGEMNQLKALVDLAHL